jgi:hypothetical protein
MTEANFAATKAKTANPNGAPFGQPNYEIPKFDLSKMEVPQEFREIAEKGAAQAKDAFEKMKIAAEQATELLKDNYATTAKGATDYNLKIIAADTSGDYLADVQVVIESAKTGRMLDTTMDGPILLVKLVPGTYTIRATSCDRTLTRTVTIGAQVGGGKFSEVVFFETNAALNSFKESNYEMSAGVKASVAASGVAASAKYEQGVAVFTLPKSGAMVAAAVGGQKFKFEPIE